VISTITLNPAIDFVLHVANLKIGEVNKSTDSLWLPGGKGINVSSCLADYLIPSVALGFAGKENFSFFENLINQKKLIQNEFFLYEGNTRINIKLADKELHQTTDVNTSLNFYSKELEEKLFNKVLELSVASKVFVVSGSLPAGFSEQFYFDLITLLKSKSVKVIFDSSGKGFKNGLKATPYMIKPNKREFEELIGREIIDLADLKNAAINFLSEFQIEVLVVSLGEDGAAFFSKNESFLLIGKKLEIANSVGAGDSMVAGFAAGVFENLDFEKMARLSMAFCASKLTKIGPHVDSKEILQKLASEMVKKEIN
jgi:1-phosphofructokinase family hexose kinase